jgi:hypothetical protein
LATPVEPFRKSQQITLNGYSFRKVQVNRILKKDPGVNVKQGDIILAVEPVVLGMIDGRLTQRTVNNYVPMYLDEQYILITRLGEPGHHVTMGTNLGRLPIRRALIPKMTHGDEQAAAAIEYLNSLSDEFNLKF